MSSELPQGINPAVPPSGDGCADCLSGQAPGWWLHLRRCAECGHVGCCDSSPSQHASRHAAEHGHSWAASFEPGEDWIYNYTTQQFFRGVELTAPTARPDTQPSPGPAGVVPADWKRHLH